MSSSITVTVLSPVTGGPFFGEVLAGVAGIIGEAGGHVVVLQTLGAGHSRDEVHRAAAFATPTGWDHSHGVISITSAAPRAYLERLLHAGKSVVLVSGDADGLAVPSAAPDNAGGMQAAVAHLIAHGHRRIGFAANLQQSDPRARHDAYRLALQDHGIEPDDAWTFEASDHSEVGGRGVARAMVEARMPVTALVAGTDRSALGLMEELARAGVSVPGDLAVVGFDGIERGSFSSPTLSTVSLQFDEVGALAARLVLARLRGESVGCLAQSVPSTFVARESCGCPSLAGIVTAPLGDGTASALGDRLGGLLAGRADSVDARELTREAVAFSNALGRAAEAGEDVPIVRVKALTRAVASFDPSPEELRLVAGVVTDSICIVSAGAPALTSLGRDALTRCAAQVNAVLWQAQSGSYLERSSRRERSVSEQYEVGLHLLDGDQGDPKELGWMPATRARAGCLALWDGVRAGGRVRVAGVYDPDAAMAGLVGETVPVEQFPPATMVASADARLGQLTFVIPVSFRGSDWGLLAVAGDVDATSVSGRETYNQWAALLATSLDQDALHANVRASEERFSLVARATNDGLWDWNLADGTIYYSDRCAELIGTVPTGDLATPSVWFDAVHPEDLARLHEALDEAAKGAPDAIEIEHRVRSVDGSYRYLLCRALPFGPVGGPAERIVGSLADIHPRKELEEQLRHAALYDEISGLPNRKLFLDRLAHAIAERRRSEHLHYAVLFIDLDGFKDVNDSLGHPMGDRLLARLGKRLRQGLRDVDLAARFGGDEFAILLHDVERSDVGAIVERMQHRLSEPADLDGHKVSVTASVGIATSDAGYSNVEDVLRDADIAMYQAKSARHGSYAFFDGGTQQEPRRSL